MNARRLFAVAACALLAAVAVPAPAAASSLVFVKRDGNVWLAAPDGTEQLQVTTDGTPADPYFSPSQSASGVIEVARGAGTAGRIYRLSRVGNRLSAPFAVTQAPVIADPVISPDGHRVALWTASAADVAAPCYTNAFCFEVTDAHSYTQVTRPAWMTFEHPAWIGTSRLLLFDDSGAVAYADLSQPGFQTWFTWVDYHPPATDGPGGWTEGAASSDGRQLALVAHESKRGRFIIDLFGGPADMRRVALAGYRPAPRRCQVTAPDGGSGADPRHHNAPAFGSLSFSPHGTEIAYAFEGSVYAATVADCRSHKVMTGSRDPFWGPASVAAPTLSVSVAPTASISALLRGLRVSVSLGGPGTVALQLARGAQSLARARVKLTAGGAKTAVLVPSPGAAAQLRGLRAVNVTLTASVVGFSRPRETVKLALTGP